MFHTSLAPSYSCTLGIQAHLNRKQSMNTVSMAVHFVKDSSPISISSTSENAPNLYKLDQMLLLIHKKT